MGNDTCGARGLSCHVMLGHSPTPRVDGDPDRVASKISPRLIRNQTDERITRLDGTIKPPFRCLDLVKCWNLGLEYIVMRIDYHSKATPAAFHHNRIIMEEMENSYNKETTRKTTRRLLFWHSL